MTDERGGQGFFKIPYTRIQLAQRRTEKIYDMKC